MFCMHGRQIKNGLNHHARYACSLVRNYFVTKDIAWNFEIKNHESFSIMVKEARSWPRSRDKETRSWPKSRGKEARSWPRSRGKEARSWPRSRGKEARSWPRSRGKEARSWPRSRGKEAAKI